MQKKPIIIISVLCVISLVLGYLSGLKEEESLSNGDVETDSKKEPEFLKEGLVAYYPFNGNAKDESGNGNDGLVKGALLVEDRNGKPLKAYSFNGQDSFIDLPASKQINYIHHISVSFWINASEKQPTGQQYSGLITRTDHRHRFSFTTGLYPNLVLGSRVSPQHNVDNKAVIASAKWMHIVFTHDGSGCALFIDGKQKSKITNRPISLVSSDLPVTIGAEGNGNGLIRFFLGCLDDIRIYNRALSAEEVKTLYEFEKAKGQPEPTTVDQISPPHPNAIEWNGNWYAHFPERITWKAAKEKCEKMGGHLVVIESIDENNFIVRELFRGVKQNHVSRQRWIGAFEESPGVWKWVKPNSQLLMRQYEFQETYNNWWGDAPALRYPQKNWRTGDYGEYVHITLSSDPDNISESWESSSKESTGSWTNDRSSKGMTFETCGYICEWEKPKTE